MASKEFESAGVVKRALLSLRHVHSSRWEGFRTGLQRCGFDVTNKPFEPNCDDVLVSWNRFPNIEPIARRFEKVGALVLIAENGWIKSDKGGMLALCAGHHNGLGWWPAGGPERWESFGVELTPWRERGERILVLPQRGYGEQGIAMPREWPQNVSSRIAQFTSRTITVRPHPGLYRPKEPDFSKIWAAVTWASGAGIKALIAGIPVFYELKGWIGSLASTYGLRDIERPWLGDRLPVFHKLAWAQWNLDEVETGEPFVRFIESRK